MSKQEGNSGEFEQTWKSALSGPEVTPPARIWSEIDHSLTQTQLTSLQKKSIVYKWTAAAAVIIATSIGVMALSFNYQEVAAFFGFDVGEGEEVVALLEENQPQNTTGNYAGFSILRNDFEGSTLTEEIQSEAEPESDLKTKEEFIPSVAYTNVRAYYPKLRSVSSDNVASTIDLIPNKQQPAIITSAIQKADRPTNVILIGKTYSNQLAVSPTNISAYGVKRVNGVMVNEVRRPVLNAQAKTRFWSGVDFASGYFNPNYGPGTIITSQELLAKEVGSREVIPELSENIRGGASYSVGINFGMELKDRWSIEVGALYSLLGARTFTNLILESEGFNNAVAYSSEIAGLESVANLVESELTKLSVDDIQINNTFQFISIPVQAGYKLLDKRFNVTINAGVAANLYLGNSLRGQQDLSSFELVPGRRSPYRSLTIATVTGFEIGYWVHRRVNLTFEPSYQKHLQSLTKEDAAFVSNPSGVGVQMGFKYDF